MQTTLYNHNLAGDNKNKDLIPNIVFKTACKRIKRFEKNVVADMQSEYSLMPEQLRLLQQLERAHQS